MYNTGNRKKLMAVNLTTKRSWRIGNFFKTMGKASAREGKKLAIKVMKSLGGWLEFGAKVDEADVSRIGEETVSSVPDVTSFCQIGEGSYLR